MEPESRKEAYLANAAGQDVELPACPWDREEAYLADIGDRINDLDDEIEHMKQNPDVVDIVATYADLEAYDKTQLTDKDIIRVLEDETHDGKSTFYRYSVATDSFTFVGEIAGGDGVKILTTADYNYPEDNPTRVALWMLPDGQYTISDKNVKVAVSTHDADDLDIARYYGLFYKALFKGEFGVLEGTSTITAFSWGMGINGEKRLYATWVVGATGTRTSMQDAADIQYVDEHVPYGVYGNPQGREFHQTGNTRVVADTSDKGRLYSANNEGFYSWTAIAKQEEGNLLKTTAPTTATEGVLGQLYTDTTTGKIYHCTAIVPQGTDPETYEYTWEEVGGGGGVKTLTAADYNSPSSSPTRIDLWLLDRGYYILKANTYYRIYSAFPAITQNNDVLVIIGQTYGGYATISIYGKEVVPECYVVLASGGNLQNTSVRSYTIDARNAQLLRGVDIVDDLTSTLGYVPLSANQGKVLNDRLVTVEGQLTGLESALNTINNGGQE